MCLQQSIPHEEAPPLPQLLAALKKGLLTYGEKRNSLLSQQDATAAPSVHVEAASCYDKHEKCPFWASIVGGLLPYACQAVHCTSYLQHAFLRLSCATYVPWLHARCMQPHCSCNRLPTLTHLPHMPTKCPRLGTHGPCFMLACLLVPCKSSTHTAPARTGLFMQVDLLRAFCVVSTSYSAC